MGPHHPKNAQIHSVSKYKVISVCKTNSDMTAGTWEVPYKVHAREVCRVHRMPLILSCSIYTEINISPCSSCFLFAHDADEFPSTSCVISWQKTAVLGVVLFFALGNRLLTPTRKRRLSSRPRFWQHFLHSLRHKHKRLADSQRSLCHGKWKPLVNMCKSQQHSSDLLEGDWHIVSCLCNCIK